MRRLAWLLFQWRLIMIISHSMCPNTRIVCLNNHSIGAKSCIYCLIILYIKPKNVKVDCHGRLTSTSLPSKASSINMPALETESITVVARTPLAGVPRRFNRLWSHPRRAVVQSITQATAIPGRQTSI